MPERPDRQQAQAAATLNRPLSENASLLLGFAAVCGFSLTLPMTRIAVAQIDPLIVGLGRSLISAALGLGVILWRRDPFPGIRYLPNLLTVTLGVIVGFPVFSAYALHKVPASHGAVVTALIPLTTALVAALRAHERPSARFWLAAAAGSAIVISFIALESDATVRTPDVLLGIAVVACAVGYAEGGRLARELGGWRVISWALVLAAPILAVPVAWSIRSHGLHASPEAWAALTYMGVISMFFAFWAWYRAFADGGVARVSQIQLIQPFLTLCAAHAILGEIIAPHTLVAAVAVVITVFIGRRAAIERTQAEVLA